LTEKQKGRLINDLQAIDFEYEEYVPSLKFHRAGEGFTRKFPYGVVDFIEENDKRFASLGDIVGRIDDLTFEHAYCEFLLVNVSICAEKKHDNVRGRNFANYCILKVKRQILAYWNDILYEFNASVDRARGLPVRDLTKYENDVGNRIYEYDLNVFLRTDVRWHKDFVSPDYEERAEKAYIILNNKNNIRIDAS